MSMVIISLVQFIEIIIILIAVVPYRLIDLQVQSRTENQKSKHDITALCLSVCSHIIDDQ